MHKELVLALDQGTTSSRAILFDRQGKIVSIAQKEFRQIYPHSGYVEHDPEEIWTTQIAAAKQVLNDAGTSPENIACIGITNQRETTVVWNKETGIPLYNAIVWQDRRTADYCKQLDKEGYVPFIRKKTGLPLDPYFSATKIKWILDNIPDAKQLAAENKLLFGTIDTWLVWKLSMGALHLTDVSNASRTMLYNIHSLQWDEELLQLFGIPMQVLPQVLSSSEIYGHTDNRILGSAIPIAGIAGDQQAALFGQLCTKEGMIKNTYGTGCFMLMNTGDKPVNSDENLLTTIAWKIGGITTYALEGSIFVGGAVVQWLRDELGIIENSADIELLASEVATSEGVYMVPAFTGLGAPYWDSFARGIIIGLSRGSGKAHIARAALESIAYQSDEIFSLMQKQSGIDIAEIKVDGGAANNDLLMQFQAELIGKNIIRPKNTEITALGAAYLAGLATGFWKSMDELAAIQEHNKIFVPAKNVQYIQQKKNEWQRAVQTVLFWSSYSSGKTQ